MNKISIFDNNGLKFDLYISSQINVGERHQLIHGTRAFYFYSKGCIINETSLKLLFYKTDKKGKRSEFLSG